MLKKEVPIVFCADAKYGAYLPVVVQSIIENSSEKYSYVIIVFDCGITHDDLQFLERHLAPYDNFSLQVEDVVSALQEYKDIFVEREYWSIATYGRFFIPEICKKYENVIYADIDMVFNRDIAELIDTDLGEDYIGAVAEPENDAVYLAEELGIYERGIYVNAGIILFNIPLWRQYNLSEKAIQLLEKRQLKVLDQDAINIVCRGKIKYLSAFWNCQLMGGKGMYFLGRLAAITPVWKDWQQAYRSNTAVLHYNSPIKPWQDYALDKASSWWKYAAKTDFYLHYLIDLVNNKIAERRSPLLQGEGAENKIYTVFGLPVWQVKKARWGKRYGIGPLRLAKTKQGRENIYLYILGIKCASVRRKSN